MKKRWQETCRFAGVPSYLLPYADHVYDSLIASQYSEPHRRYHTLEHIKHCFAELLGCRTSSTSFGSYNNQKLLPAVEMAIWFHDIHYNINEPKQELASSKVCIDRCIRMEISAVGHEAETMIKMSDHVPYWDSAAINEAEKVFLDIDLSILGQDSYDYSIYEAQIRAEYKRVPDEIFYSKRKEILRGFLERPSIYYTDFFKNKYEEQAQFNLIRTVAKIENANR